MKRKTIFLLTFLTALGSQAQKVWTLQDCIDYALTNNITLHQNQLTSAQNELAIRSSKAALLPSVSFSTSHNVNYRPYSQSTINLTNGTMTTSQSETNYNGSYGVNANWTVWNGGKNRNNIKAAELNKQMSDLDTEQNANSIQQQIAQLYIQILYETEAIKVDSEIVKTSKMQRDRAQEMFKIGSLAKVDVIQLEAQITQDEYALVSAQSQLQRYQMQLKLLLELQGTENFQVAIPTLNESSVLSPIPSKQSIYETALSVRPEVQRGKLDIDAAKLNEKIARAGYMPTINMNASLGSSSSSGAHMNFADQMKKNWSNGVGLSLSLPIFDQKQTRTSVSRAKISTLASELQLQNTEKNLYSEIENYWLQATTSQQQYKAACANVSSMQESYNLVSEQFKLGLKNIVELTTGKNNLLQAQQSRLQSKYTALYNIAMLRFYQGQKMQL